MIDVVIIKYVCIYSQSSLFAVIRSIKKTLIQTLWIRNRNLFGIVEDMFWVCKINSDWYLAVILTIFLSKTRLLSIDKSSQPALVIRKPALRFFKLNVFWMMVTSSFSMQWEFNQIFISRFEQLLNVTRFFLFENSSTLPTVSYVLCEFRFKIALYSYQNYAVQYDC